MVDGHDRDEQNRQEQKISGVAPQLLQWEECCYHFVVLVEVSTESSVGRWRPTAPTTHRYSQRVRTTRRLGNPQNARPLAALIPWTIPPPPPGEAGPQRRVCRSSKNFHREFPAVPPARPLLRVATKPHEHPPERQAKSFDTLFSEPLRENTQNRPEPGQRFLQSKSTNVTVM